MALHLDLGLISCVCFLNRKYTNPHQPQSEEYNYRMWPQNKLELLFSQYERDIHNNPPQLGGFYSRNNKRIVLNISGE